MRIPTKLKSVGMIGIADILGAGISSACWFYLASVIEPDEYGKITFLFSIALLASVVSLFGSNRSLIVYPAKGIEIQTAMYVITLSLGVLLAIATYFFVSDVGTSFITIGLILMGLITAELVGRKLYIRYTKYLILQRALMLSITILGYNLFGFEAIIPAIAISYTPYIIEIIRGFKKFKINFRLIRENIVFIKNNYFESLSGVIGSTMDKLIVGQFFGFAILGNYALGFQFATLLGIIPTAVAKYLISEESSGSKNTQLKKYMIIFSIIIAVLAFLVGPQVISYIFPKFSAVENIIRIMCWTVIPNTINTSIFWPRFLSMERGRIILFGSVSWTCTLLIGVIVLGNYFQSEGISLSFLLASIASTIFYTIIYKRDSYNS